VNTIVLQIDIPGVTHVLLDNQQDYLLVLYLTAKSTDYNGTVTQLDQPHSERYYYRDHPELFDMFDGLGWNVEDVALFVQSLMPEFAGESK
jgi:hypothetical protein